MENPMMFESTDMIYGLMKSQMEKLEAEKEKFKAEEEKRKATVQTIIEALDGCTWELAEALLRAAEIEMKKQFVVSINKVVDSQDVKI